MNELIIPQTEQAFDETPIEQEYIPSESDRFQESGLKWQDIQVDLDALNEWKATIDCPASEFKHEAFKAWAKSITNDDFDVARLMQVHPMDYRMLVKPIKPALKTKGGIIKVHNTLEAEEFYQRFGWVVTMGKGCFHNTDGGYELRTTRCYAGDKVMFPMYAGDPIRINGEFFRVIPDTKIIASMAPDMDVTIFDESTINR